MWLLWGCRTDCFRPRCKEGKESREEKRREEERRERIKENKVEGEITYSAFFGSDRRESIRSGLNLKSSATVILFKSSSKRDEDRDVEEVAVACWFMFAVGLKLKTVEEQS